MATLGGWFIGLFGSDRVGGVAGQQSTAVCAYDLNRKWGTDGRLRRKGGQMLARKGRLQQLWPRSGRPPIPRGSFLTNSPDIAKLLGSTEPARNSKIYAYLCALSNYALSKNGNASGYAIRITCNTMGYIAILLNWLVYTFITLYIVCLYLNSIPTFKVNPETLSGPSTAWSILVMWFPLRLFSDWALWYDDLDHLITGDPPFFCLSHLQS
jgi:hypothetical protein